MSLGESKHIAIKSFKKFKGVTAFITTRNGGESVGFYSSLNLSYKSGDILQTVEANRAIVAKMLGVTVSNLIFPDQCHTANIKSVTGSTTGNLENSDALITKTSGIAIGILAADCVPILFYDPKNHVIAAVHAGWRGTVQNIVVKTINSFISEYKCNPKNIHVVIGPCISQKNYEVGPEVIRAISALKLSNYTEFIIPSEKQDHARVDLQGINEEIMLKTGIPKNQIEILDYCTFDNKDVFYSARRDGFNCGRFAGVIMLH